MFSAGALNRRSSARPVSKFLTREWRKGCLQLAEDLFEQIECARIVALPQPEQRALAQLGIRVGLYDVNQAGDSFSRVTLRKREDCLLPHLPVAGWIANYGIECKPGGRFSRLTEPEHCGSPPPNRKAGVPGNVKQRGPDGHAVGQRRG